MWTARVWQTLGWLLLILAGLELFPLGMAIAKGNGPEARAFVMSFAATAFLGAVLLLAFRGLGKARQRRIGFIIAAAIWLLLPLMAALPLWWADVTPGYWAAYFEAVAELTTTGASRLAADAQLSDAILLWRGLLTWAGGFLTVIVVVTIFIPFNIGAMALHDAPLPHGEGESLGGRLRGATRALLPLYLAVTIILWLLLTWAGEPRFEALCLALATVSTGGLSPHGAGRVGLDSGVPVLLLLIVFMMIGALSLPAQRNFLRLGVHRRPFRAESRVLLMILGVTSLVTVLILALRAIGEFGMTFGTAAVDQIFMVVSLLTTTGFVIDGAADPPVALKTVLMTMTFVGGAAVSTAGGIKMMRLMVLIQHARRELRRLSHPSAVLPVIFERRAVGESDVTLTLNVVLLLAGALFAGFLAFCLTGLSYENAFALAVTGISNAGPAIGYLGDGFGGFETLDAFQSVIYVVLMVTGRLEAVVLVALFSRAFWRR